jgi:hypothetical protein
VATVIVGGALANKPLNGGEAWVRLTWVLGIRRLGFDVCFAEEIAPEQCVDEQGELVDFDRSVNRFFFEQVTDEFGLAGSACLVCGEDGRTAGLSYEDLLARADGADLLVNISGHVTRGDLLRAPKARLYVDLDPGFTQLWHASGTPGLRLAGHDHYVTVGGNIGTASCSLPTSGLKWRTTLPPVLLDEWEVADALADTAKFTTIATWRSPYGPVDFGGELHGLKHHEFRKFLDLPRRLCAEFELALDIDPADAADLEALQSHGWTIVDPRSAVPDPSSYRAYIRGSAAEFSVAQGIYVSTNSGWFSDRTACYLASGKPAMVQETGFGVNLPVGSGLVAFRDLDEAVKGAKAIGADYGTHSRAAREIAERHFNSDLVLSRLLEILV